MTDTYAGWIKNKYGVWRAELRGNVWELAWGSVPPDKPRGGQETGAYVWVRFNGTPWVTSEERSLVETVRRINAGEDPRRRDYP